MVHNYFKRFSFLLLIHQTQFLEIRTDLWFMNLFVKKIFYFSFPCLRLPIPKGKYTLRKELH